LPSLDQPESEKGLVSDSPSRRVTGRFEFDIPQTERSHEKRHDEEEGRSKNLGHDLRRRLREATFVVEVVGVALLCVYATIAALQWRELKKTNDLTIAANARTLEAVVDYDRPWLGVHHIDALELAPGKKMGGNLTLLNSGQTPALHTGVVTHAVMARPGEEASAKGTPENAQVVFPNMDFRIEAKTDSELSAEDVEAIKARTKFLMLVGHFVYQDRLKRSHETYFCAVYDAENNNFGPCKGGNEAN